MGFPAEQSTAQRTAVQIADIPVLGDGGRLAGLHGCLSGQGSTAAGAEQLADIPSSGLTVFSWTSSRGCARAGLH